MTQRLQMVVDAAERAAQAIREDAEEQAHRYLEAAQRKADRLTAERVKQISDLSDDLIRHAGVVRERSEEMVRGLEVAIGSVTESFDRAGADSSPEATVPGAETDFESNDPSAAGSSEDAPPGAAVPPASGASEDGKPIDAALIHATRLAVAGEDRETVANSLRNEFGIEEPASILDRVIGDN